MKLSFVVTRKLIPLVLACTVLLSGCDQLLKGGSGGGGAAFANGAGYGGQPLYLRKTLDRIVASLGNYQDGFNAETFGVYSASTCENLGDPILCERLISPSANKRNTARAFLNARLETLRALPDKATFTLMEGPLYQTLPSGEQLPVNALAELGGNKIFIDVDAFRGQSVSAQVATLVHEMLHLADKETRDDVANGEWSQTRDMLDFIGTATAAYYVDNLGKVVTTFPSATATCHDAGTRNILDIAPYFQPPVNTGDPDGQFSNAARSFVNNQIQDKSFTITVWAKLDPTDLATRDANFLGEALVSNFNQASHNGYKVFGLALFRSSESKNFAAYAGTYELLDSGISFPADDQFHHLVVRKNTATGKISTFVDGVSGNEFSDKYLSTADFDPVFSTDPAGEVATETVGSLENSLLGNPIPFGIGRAGGVAETNNCNLSQFKDSVSSWECLRRFKGNIAAISLYKDALANEKIQALSRCGRPK